MSLRRQVTPFKRYSLSPERYKRRPMVTSRYSEGRMPLWLSKVSRTSAKAACLRLLVPLKITPSILSERSIRDFCSPNTHRMASTTLDLPLPLGPTIPVTPSLNRTKTRSPKLLKPLTSISVSRIFSVSYCFRTALNAGLQT